MDYPRDVFKTNGSRAVLNCTVNNCTHDIRWRTNAASYRNLLAIEVGHTGHLEGISVYVVEFSSLTCYQKQSFVIHKVTAEWHEKSVQCEALSKNNGSPSVYSRFATVFIEGKSIVYHRLSLPLHNYHIFLFQSCFNYWFT